MSQILSFQTLKTELLKWAQSYGVTQPLCFITNSNKHCPKEHLPLGGFTTKSGNIVINLECLLVDWGLTMYEVKFIILHEYGHLVGTQASPDHEWYGKISKEIPKEAVIFRESEADAIAADKLGLDNNLYKTMRLSIFDKYIVCFAERKGYDIKKAREYIKDKVNLIINGAIKMREEKNKKE